MKIFTEKYALVTLFKCVSASMAFPTLHCAEAANMFKAPLSLVKPVLLLVLSIIMFHTVNSLIHHITPRVGVLAGRERACSSLSILHT